MPVRIDPNTGERIVDGGAIDPTTGERVANASSSAPSGFMSSALQSSGLSGMAQAVLHPINTIAAIPAAVQKGYQESKDQINQGIDSYKKEGLSTNTRRSFVHAIPILGNTLDQAQRQQDSGDTAGALGTLAGTVAGFAGPEIAGRAASGLLKGSGKVAQLAATSPDAAKLAATRAIVPGTAGEVLNRALKPGVQYGAGTAGLFDKTLGPTIATGMPIKDVSSLASAVDTARDANAAAHAKIMAPYQGATPRSLFINGNEVMQAQADSVPAMKTFEGTAPSKLATSANSPYNRMIPAAEADSLRKGSNQTLAGFYAKAPGDQYAALANPEASRVKAVGDNIRQQLYPAIETDQNLPAGSVGESQQMYGNLSTLGDIANRRDIVFGRHDPVSLAEKVATSHGGPVATAFNFAKERALRGLTDSDALVRSALDRYQNPAATPLPAGNNFLQGSVVAPTGIALKATGNALSKANPFLRYAGAPFAGGTQ